MIYITQLVFVKEGKEKDFYQFEDKVLPLLEKYNGKLLYRLRPDKNAFIFGMDEHPHEIHIISFKSEEDIKMYSNDSDRRKHVYLKEASVKSSLIIKGEAF